MKPRKYKEPEIIRQEVYWVPKDRRVPIPGDRPYRVWTLFLETDPDKRPEIPAQVIHRHNGFLEDYIHDWNWRDGCLIYGSRAIESEVWILLQYAAPKD